MSIGSSPSRLPWVRVPWAMVALVVAGVLHGSPGKAADAELPPARSGAMQAHGDRRVSRVVEISPRIGSPGTHVTLKVAGMPALTPVQIAIGATRTGFEALALALTTIDGDLDESVEVPTWSKRDQAHRFIVFNLYFSATLAESAIFHVTDADGLVVREGVVARSSPACLTLEGDDGERYRLSGVTGGLEVGARVLLEGALTELQEACAEGVSLDLELRSTPS